MNDRIFIAATFEKSADEFDRCGCLDKGAAIRTGCKALRDPNISSDAAWAALATACAAFRETGK